MNHRNPLLLGLSSIALQGCVAAAAIPIVAGGGALVRDSVSDDARSGSRERVSVVTPPAATPTPTPAPALATATPAQQMAPATQPIAAPTPTPTPTAAPLATTRSEPVIVATLDDYSNIRSYNRTPTPAPAPTPTPTPAAIAASQIAEEPVAAAPEPAPPSEELAFTEAVEEPVAAIPAPQPEPEPERLADVGLPPEPVAEEPEQMPALAVATPAEEPSAAAIPEEPAQNLAVAEPEPQPATVPEPIETIEPTPAAAEQAFVAAEPPAEPPAASASQFPTTSPAGGGYGALRGYALRTLGGGLPLPSAMLADPTSLQPIRRDCQGNAPTVVIDLDPAGSVVPIAGPLAVNNELARILADLRLRNVQIAWITDRGPIDARAVRDRLVASGLDPSSQDSLYVERYPGETKQARRAALAQTQCVIALAGDERSDFDDLYNYIIEPSDARNLELLLGNGWFLIENPVGE